MHRASAPPNSIALRLAAALLFLLPLVPFAGGRAGAFEGERAKGILDTLASDAFLGRKSGLAGGRMSEKYAAARFRAWGLEPGGESGTFFQSFPMLVTKDGEAVLEVLDGPYAPLSFLAGDEFVVTTNSGSGDVVAEAVLVGYGIASPERGRDDYGAADVRGKIVVVLQEQPDALHDWERAIARDSTMAEAARRGAAGVLWLRGDRAVAGGAVHEGSYRPDLVLATIGPRVLEHLLFGTGYDGKRYKDEVATKPLVLPTGKRLHFRANVERLEGGAARNIVGIVRGSDPRLRDEIIVVGGHIDHIGADAKGRVYNGANDNASGASIVMELARAFAEAEKRPARTIVFAEFAGEEQGLLGSRAFVEKQPIDLGAVVAMINLDVEGHGNGKVGIGGGEFFPEAWDDFRGTLGEALAESLVAGRPWGGESSDHAPFRNAGIPAMNIWSEGEHRFYHTIEDDPEWVTEGVLGSVGRMAERWIRALADRPEPLARPHRTGRTLLAGSDQIDFDGTLGGGAPACVRGAVRWIDAGEAGEGAFIEKIGTLHLHADAGDSIAVVTELREVRGSSREGRRCALVGLRGDPAGLPPALATLLGDVGIGLVAADPSAPEDSAGLERCKQEGIDLLLPVAAAGRADLPEEGKRYVRFYPERGEEPTEPDFLSRKTTLFVASLEGKTAPGPLAKTIRTIGWDRVHLDVTPWLARAGGAPERDRVEEEIAVFLEELQEQGPFEPFQMRDLLGGNLARF